MNNHPIHDMMEVAMKKIREMVDVNIIIGEKINIDPNISIIPISKVSFGFGSGGSDIGSNKQKDLFGGGCGAGISIQPISFLVVNGSDVKMLEISQSSNTADKVVNMMPELIDKISGLFSKKDKENSIEA